MGSEMCIRDSITPLQHRDRDVASADLHNAVACEEARELVVTQPEHGLSGTDRGNRRHCPDTLDRADHSTRRVGIRGDRKPLREYGALERYYRLLLGNRLRDARREGDR